MLLLAILGVEASISFGLATSLSQWGDSKTSLLILFHGTFDSVAAIVLVA